MYKTKGKGSNSQEKDLANAPENKDAAAATNTATTSATEA